MSKERRDSLAKSGWFPLKTYNASIHQLEVKGVIEVRNKFINEKRNLYYRLTPKGLSLSLGRIPQRFRLAAAFDVRDSKSALLSELRIAYSSYLHRTWLRKLSMSDRKPAFLIVPRRKW